MKWLIKKFFPNILDDLLNAAIAKLEALEEKMDPHEKVKWDDEMILFVKENKGRIKKIILMMVP